MAKRPGSGEGGRDAGKSTGFWGPITSKNPEPDIVLGQGSRVRATTAPGPQGGYITAFVVNTAGAEGACKNIYRVYSPKLDVDYRTAYLLSSFLELRRSGYWPNSATPAVEWVSLEDRRSQMDDAIERWLQLSLHGTLDAISGQKEHEIAGVVREVLSETVAELRDLGVHLEKIEKNEPSAGIDVIEAEIFDNEFYEVLSEAAALLGSANEDLKSRSAAIDERLAKLEMSVDE